MLEKKKKKSPEGKSKTGLSKRAIIEQRRAKLSEKGGNGDGFIYFKEGTARARIVQTPDDKDFGVEFIRFYIGGDVKSIISPATFGEPCALMEFYNKCKAGDEDDKALAGTMGLGRRWAIPMYVFKDDKGKELDDRGVRLGVLTSSQYQEVLDYWLDDEQGDFSDPLNGYDIKFKRTGSGKFDTEYSTTPCKPTPMLKDYRKIYDPEEMLREVMPTYEETQRVLDGFLQRSGAASDGEDEDESPKKAKAKKTSSSLSKKSKLKKKTKDV